MHTVDAKEIENFAKDSAQWWDEDGPFRPLHRLNPVRLTYIKDQICARYDRDTKSLKPFKGLSILDIGCGGGLVCEPMARLGATITGIDADANAIAVAKDHAAQGGLDVIYKCASTDSLLSSSAGQRLSSPPRAGIRMPAQGGHDKEGMFDVVLALEIVEHVADVDGFVDDCVNLCKPDGLIIFSTLNRTPRSFLLGKIAAEYILGWVPQGTHDWKKFLKPSELAKSIRAAGGELNNLTGMVFDPIKGGFKLSDHDVSVNYFAAVSRGNTPRRAS